MPSFQITLSPAKRAAGRFVYGVRRKLQKAYSEEQKKRGLTQTAIAAEIGVHRSVINRELRGAKDITLGRVAELAAALGRTPVIEFPETIPAQGQNIKAKIDYSMNEQEEASTSSDSDFELEAA
jgi:transcriptional regulator with XRE-family HTH domain